ncbi:MAG: Ig-like domain-containing protein, partial [Gemmatimonadota bacterium]
MFRTLTAAVATLGVVAALTTLGCGNDGTSPQDVMIVSVQPGSTQVQAGSTVQFIAIAFDGSGRTVSGVSFTWTSADQTVATVDANGLATGQVMGTTDIRAATGAVTGSGKIVVVPNSNPDPPDDAFLDSNGDGIDGDIAQAVFVAPSGADANPGTIDQPKATLAAAIAAAVADAAKSEIYVGAGTYAETVQLADGISMYGGYDAAANWQRTASNVVLIDGDTAAVIAQSLGRRTVLDLVTIRSADNATAGGSSTGIYVADSDSLVLRNLSVTAGDGAPGAAGTAGTAGASGSAGAAGLVPAGGIGGPSPVANDGGAGGDGSTGAPLGDNGLPGLGPSGGAGGAGGADGLVCPGSGFDGSDGTAGGAGAPGTHGAGGDGVGTVVSG